MSVPKRLNEIDVIPNPDKSVTVVIKILLNNFFNVFFHCEKPPCFDYIFILPRKIYYSIIKEVTVLNIGLLKQAF